ncbi:cupredoxin family copper-binding protein [Mycobacterium sp. 663a-19]|uniref:cupredoxin domain-containing protein n=1 Tax=Mycobacterium sp. 663a-19 TaxID=2986148 RepID=UPI002D1EBAF2|nr:cupredoxin family copper-binding protein [Mycobacterium sp. 663a-19]MEB3982981.1 cupredoxin family copper-binding protein [Mycobacterium sp. 663a-19]
MNIAKLRQNLIAASAVGALLAGCSSSPPAAQPSVTFGSNTSGTPGMSGMSGMPSMPGPSASAPGTGSPAAVAGDQVSIDNFAFAPATLTVKAGSTVTWTNRDEEPHTVAASDGSFHSPGMGTGATFSHTFPTAGTFDYVCSIHPMMRGSVVVTG